MLWVIFVQAAEMVDGLEAEKQQAAGCQVHVVMQMLEVYNEKWPVQDLMLLKLQSLIAIYSNVNMFTSIPFEFK